MTAFESRITRSPPVDGYLVILLQGDLKEKALYVNDLKQYPLRFYAIDFNIPFIAIPGWQAHLFMLFASIKLRT